MSEETVREALKVRNALRAEAKLPLLDKRAEVARGLAEERQQDYRAFLDQHASLLRDYRLQAVAEFEERNGRRPGTAFGWWGVYHTAQKRFEAEIERRFGVPRPRI